MPSSAIETAWVLELGVVDEGRYAEDSRSKKTRIVLARSRFHRVKVVGCIRPRNGDSMSKNLPGTILLVVATGLSVIAARRLRQKKAIVDVTVQQMEDTLAAMDPAARAAAIARLVADGGAKVSDHIDH